jgi:15-cis-phytoene synthase
MNTLYDQVNFNCAKIVANSYSTSFSLGIRMFDKRFRDPIYAIYAFARYADEIVDTFQNIDKVDLLNRFESETHIAIQKKLSLNPILHAYQFIVNKYGIDHKHIDAFFDSMRMDIDTHSHNDKSYSVYIYGSAEVIGLMCLKVFTFDKPSEYEALEPFARALGSAFQKINFLRDIEADFKERKRIYFPNVDFFNFDKSQKEIIEKDIKNDFDNALEGIKKLPDGAKLGVYVAYTYYYNLYDKIVNTSHNTLTKRRIRINNFQKTYLLTVAGIKNKFFLK